MNYGIAIRHPEHVRFFRYPIRSLQSDGHDVHVYAREHGHTTDLLRAFDIPHSVLAGEGTSTAELVGGHLVYEARMLVAARRDDVDVLASIGGRTVSHLAPAVGARSVVFMDWEGSAVDRIVALLADVVCTPAHVDTEFGRDHVRYEGCHELAYLHSDRFRASAASLRERGVDPDDQLFVLGFRDHDATAGLSRPVADEVASLLADYGTVLRSHESAADGDAAGTRVPPTVAHDALAHADLYVGDSGTMAAEAAVLGTPAVRLRNDEPPEPRCRRLQEKYGLLYSTADGDALVEQVKSVVTDPGTDELWQHRRGDLLDDATDVTGFVTNLLRTEARA